MFPTLYEISPGGMGVHTYGLFIVLALSAAFLLVHSRSARVGIPPDKMMVNYLAAAAGGLFGARFLYVLSVVGFTNERVLPVVLFWVTSFVALAFRAMWRGWDTNKVLRIFGLQIVVFAALSVAVDAAMGGSLVMDFLREMTSTGAGGFAYYGGIIGGGVGVLIASSLMGLNAWKIADLAGPAIVIGLGVGRMGCFFAGCCHGAVAPMGPDPHSLLPEGLLHGQIWLSSRFPFITTEFNDGVGRLLNEPLYPTQLWSVVTGLSLAAFLSWLWTKRRFDGQIAGITLLIEPPTRAFIESFRADARGYAFTVPVSDTVAAWFPGLTQAGGDMSGAVMGVTTSQLTGAGLMVLGALLLVIRRNAGREPEVSVAAQDEAIMDELLT
jgi:phosphatidylglycerol---prolipoprotein diacylglyceryl transferase